MCDSQVMQYDNNIETQAIAQAQLVIEMFHKMGIAGASTVADYEQAKARVTAESVQLQEWQERKRTRANLRTNCSCKTCGKACGCFKGGRKCTDECACDGDCTNGDAPFDITSSTLGTTGGSGMATQATYRMDESPFRVPLQRTMPAHKEVQD
jgi:hypothetical protein